MSYQQSIYLCTVSESSPTDLQWYGRGDLIQDALKKMIFCRQEDVINILFPCWLNLLEKIQGQNSSAKPSGLDILIKELLYKIEMETQATSKRAYIKQLKPVIEALGIGCVRWMASSKIIII